MKRLLKKYIPIILFSIIGLFFFLNLFLFPQGPHINRITPELVASGEIVTINGSNLGANTREGRLFLGNSEPPPSAIKSWSSTTITFEVPSSFSGGLLYVMTNLGKSQVSHLAGRQDLPISFLEEPRSPQLLGYEPSKPIPGQSLHILGKNLGFLNDDSKVIFSSESDLTVPGSLILSQEDLESWSENELVIKVPGGFSKGHLVVKTPKGLSNPLPIDIETNNVILGPWKQWAFTSKTTISSWPASGKVSFWYPGFENTLGLFIEKVDGLSNPFDMEWGGLKSYFAVKDPQEKERQIAVNWKLKTRSVSYTLAAPPVYPPNFISSAFFKVHTREDGAKINDVKSFREILGSLGGYGDILSKAKRVFEVPGKEKLGNPTLVFIALCREMGIPARLVAGYRVNAESKVKKHLWSEVYFYSQGWIPVDPDGGLFGELSDRYLEVFKGFPPQRILESFLDLSSTNLEQYSVIWQNEAVLIQ